MDNVQKVNYCTTGMCLGVLLGHPVIGRHKYRDLVLDKADNLAL
jgi:hypothetical protein